MKIGKLQHKQNCADRLQSLSLKSASCLRKIKEQDYVPTQEQKEEMDRLLTEYNVAKDAYVKAENECDTIVYVIPIM